MFKTKYMLALLAAAGLLGAAACDRSHESEPARQQADAGTTEATPDASEAADEDRSDRGSREDRVDPRTQPVPVHDDGTPLWAPNSRRTAQENAERQFERNGAAFGARTVDAYVDKVHAFISNPPAGTLRHTRPNGDKLFYDPKGNVFAVASKEGAPRTMFKPDEGMAYWEKQKQTQARRNGSGQG